MTFNFLGPGLTVNVEAKVKEQIILDSSGVLCMIVHGAPFNIFRLLVEKAYMVASARIDAAEVVPQELLTLSLLNLP